MAFVLLETTLIIFLIVQKRRKKVTEESLRRKTEELDQFFNVSLDLLSIVNTDGYFLRAEPCLGKDPWLLPAKNSWRKGSSNSFILTIWTAL